MIQVELPDKISPEEAGRYIHDSGFCVQEKRNGKHRLLYADRPLAAREHVLCYNRKGEEVNFPQVLAKALLSIPFQNGVILDVEQEQHDFYILDLLAHNGEMLIDRPYEHRLQTAERLFSNRHPHVHVIKSYYGEEKMKVISGFQADHAEGVVFKDLRAPYKQGRAGQHKALKFWKTLDAFVLGRNPEGKDAVMLGVMDEHGTPVRICGASLIGKVPVNDFDVVEIKYLYATPDLHVVQPTILRKRDDKSATECGVDQLYPNINKNWR